MDSYSTDRIDVSGPPVGTDNLVIDWRGPYWNHWHAILKAIANAAPGRAKARRKRKQNGLG